MRGMKCVNCMYAIKGRGKSDLEVSGCLGDGSSGRKGPRRVDR